MLEITSVKNPLIKEIKSLYRKKERMKSRSFIIEGIKMIEEALNDSYHVQYIVYTDQLLNTKDGSDFFERIKLLDNLVYVPDNVFKEISDTENIRILKKYMGGKVHFCCFLMEYRIREIWVPLLGQPMPLMQME